MIIDKIRAYSKREGLFYIDDLYWFEEQGVRQWNGGSGHYDEFRFMLPTGVRDRNGTLVYEGDIVRYYYLPGNTSRYAGGNYVVKFKPPCFVAGGQPLGATFYDFEVIGNRFENAELLEAAGGA